MSILYLLIKIGADLHRVLLQHQCQLHQVLIHHQDANAQKNLIESENIKKQVKVEVDQLQDLEAKNTVNEVTMIAHIRPQIEEIVNTFLYLSNY